MATYDGLKAMDPHGFSGHVDTIFHEMTHAEYFNFIVKDYSYPDTKLHKIITSEVIPWIEKNESGLEEADMDFNISNGISEWQGYFVGTVVNEIIQDLKSLEKYNGFDEETGEITITKYLKKQALVLNKEEFSKFVLHKIYQSGYWTKDYWVRVRPGFDVKAFAFTPTVSVEPSELKKLGFKESWWKALWDHFEYYTKAHDNISDLCQWMADHSMKRHALKKVRDKYWDSIHLAKEEKEAEDQTNPDFTGINQ
ncbi:hypothetical protein MJH12_19245 [bacterium]|nr:hypothetical protein [bacterium]